MGWRRGGEGGWRGRRRRQEKDDHDKDEEEDAGDDQVKTEEEEEKADGNMMRKGEGAGLMELAKRMRVKGVAGMVMYWGGRVMRMSRRWAIRTCLRVMRMKKGVVEDDALGEEEEEEEVVCFVATPLKLFS